MTKPELNNLTVSQLVDHFAENGVAQYKAIEIEDSEIYNDLYWKMHAINEELKSRGDEARLALLKLYNHPNMQVRLAAARSTLAVAPVAARHQLEAIVSSRWFPQAGDAGMTLWRLDEGEFKPT
jgi:cytochrome c oxidase assembly protein Cox11